MRELSDSDTKTIIDLEADVKKLKDEMKELDKIATDASDFIDKLQIRLAEVQKLPEKWRLKIVPFTERDIYSNGYLRCADELESTYTRSQSP